MKKVLFVFLLISCISVDVRSKTFGENGNLANEQTNNTCEYVDLGLSVKWATCNVGANSPEEYGSYFAWGEITTKNNYVWDTYKYGSSYDKLTKYGDVDIESFLSISASADSLVRGHSIRPVHP